MKKIYCLLSLFFLTSIINCSSQVNIKDPGIPNLLVTQLPYHVAIIYPKNFENFTHEEKVIGRKSWKIDFTRSNKLLFNKIFSSFFSGITVLDEADSTSTLEFDLVIKPSIDAIEFSVPEQSQDETFSVWIRYRIKIFDNNGIEIINWPISSYGKASTSTFADEQDLANAAVLAMRDAAALIILQIEKSKKITNIISSMNRQQPL
ncbi:MAG TPA: hypothetical protein QGF04_05570 [Woeseiaceae bacterium]|nr:hypothetical protein [Woeseiaceae bacterium]